MNILFKFSGEFFTSNDELTKDGIIFLNSIKTSDLKSGYIVVGGGNRIRGKESRLTRNTSDKLGVLSTIFNSFVLCEYLAMLGLPSVVFSHFNDFGIKYSPEDAVLAFSQEKFVILSSGLGSVGYISTDLSSVIKALELNVDALLKVTKVEGIYDKSPDQNDAKLLNKVSYDDVIKKNLSVIDLAAVSIASENDLPIGICSVNNFSSFLKGEDTGSIIGYDWRK